MIEEVDRISEHMRYLNIKPISTLTRTTEVSRVEQASNSAQDIDAMGMVKQLQDDNKSFIDILTEVSQEAEKQNQYATANLVQDLMESHGKFVWFLRSFTEK
jgi:starvation-inducible DNA-binding protein